MKMDADLLIVIQVVSILIVVLTALSITLLYMDKNRKLQRGQEILRSQLEIQEQSFENVYKEIHDNIGQVLSLARINLHSVEPDVPEPANEKLRCTKELVGKAIMDLRSLSKTLDPEFIRKEGFNEAIKRELLIIDKDGLSHTSLREKGSPFRLDRQKELILFRIFQEHLNNVVTYAKAKNVNVELDYHPRHLSLAVSDDGLGLDSIDQDSKDNRISAGIRNMRNRATLIGAVIQFTTLIGGGSKIFIDLPLK